MRITKRKKYKNAFKNIPIYLLFDTWYFFSKFLITFEEFFLYPILQSVFYFVNTYKNIRFVNISNKSIHLYTIPKIYENTIAYYNYTEVFIFLEHQN